MRNRDEIEKEIWPANRRHESSHDREQRIIVEVLLDCRDLLKDILEYK